MVTLKTIGSPEQNNSSGYSCTIWIKKSLLFLRQELAITAVFFTGTRGIFVENITYIINTMVYVTNNLPLILKSFSHSEPRIDHGSHIYFCRMGNEEFIWKSNMHSLYQTTNHLALLVLEEKMVKVSAIQNQEVPIVAMFFLCEL